MFDPREIQRWFMGKNFTADWTSPNFQKLCRILELRRDRIKRLLEIGQWEGRSAVFFLEFCAQAVITCVDTLRGGIENHADPNLPLIGKRFDQNVGAYGARVSKMKSDSIVALHMQTAGQSFDLAYMERSHQRDDIIIDSLLTRIGTIIIWDDYGGQRDPNNVCVKPAVDLFLSLYSKFAAPIDFGYRVVIERRV